MEGGTKADQNEDDSAYYAYLKCNRECDEIDGFSHEGLLFDKRSCHIGVHTA